MGWPEYGHLTHWLLLFGQSVAVGMVVVVVYATMRSTVELRRARLEAAVIGVLFGVSAIVSEAFPVQLGGGMIFDARYVFVGVGSMFGGPIAAVIAGVLSSVYRAWLGGPYAVLGIGAIAATGAVGIAVNLYYGERIKEFGLGRFALVGFANAIAILIIRGLFHLIGVGGPVMPVELVMLTTFVPATALIGAAMSLIHDRAWRQVQRRLTDIVDTVSELVWEIDDQHRFTFVSPRFETALGIRPADMLGRTPESLGLFWQDEITAVTHDVAFAAHKPIDGLHKVITRDGTRLVLSVSARPFFGRDGRFAGYRGTAVDITEREKWRMTVALISGRIGNVVGEDFLKTLIQSVAEMLDAHYAVIGVYEDDGVMFRTLVRYAHATFISNHTTPTAEMPSADIRGGKSVVIPSDFKHRYPRFAAVVDVDLESCAAMPLINSRGDILGMLLVAFVRPLASGTIETVLQLFAGRAAAEIERVMIEEEWKANRERLLIAQHIGQIASLERDLVQQKSTWSAELWDILGIDRSQRPTFELFLESVHPDDRPMLAQLRDRSIAGDSNGPGEFRILRPDGEVRWLYRQAELVHDAAGKAVRLVVMLQDVTNRRHLEAELLRSREHLLLAQRTAGIGSAEVDLRSGREYWSDELINMLGLDPKAMRYSFEQFLASIHPDDRERVRSLRARNNAGAPTEPIEFRIVRPDGGVRWLRRQIRALYDDEGKLSGLIATHQDITERRRMEQELRDNHDRLVRAQRVGRIGSTEMDCRTGTSTWSDGEYRLLGLEPAKGGASSELFLSMVHPDDRGLLRNAVDRNSSGEETPSVEFRIVRPDGEVRWLLRDVEIERDAAGKPMRYLTTKQDITDRKRMEQSLRYSYEGLVRAQRMGKIGSAEVDVATGKVVWSEEQLMLYGLDVPIQGFEEYLKLLHPEDRRLMRAARERDLRGDLSDPFEFRIIRSDGDVRWIHREVDGLYDADGRLVTLFTTQQDVTERKRLEEELIARTRHLASAQRVGKMASVEIELATGKVVWSAEAYHLFGVDPEVGQPRRAAFLNLIHPEDRERMIDAWAREKQGQETEPFEYRLLRRNDKTRWLYRQAEFVRNAEGRPARLIVAHQDVTEREELRRLMAVLGGNLGNPIGEDFLKGLLVNVAQVAGAELAYIGRPVAQGGVVRAEFLYTDGVFVDGCDIPVWETCRTVLASARLVRIDRDFAQHCPDAPSLLAGFEAFGGTPLLSAKGEILGMLAVASRRPWQAPDHVETLLNLSAPRAAAEIERLASEGDAERSRQRMAEVLSALDIARDAIVMGDEQQYIIYTNKAALDLLGLPGQPGEIEGKRLRDFQVGEGFSSFADEALQMMGEKGEWQGTGAWIRPSDGKTIFFDARMHRLPNGGFVTVGGDATRRIRLEEEERRRQEWQAQASKLEALGNLAGGIAHDFNNLLGAILGFGQFLVEDLDEGSEPRHFAERIVAVSQRGRSLVQQILTFARRGPVEASDVDLSQVVAETHELLRATLPATTELTVENRVPDAVVLGDRGQLSQVFVNLCVNGSDALAGKIGAIAILVDTFDRGRPELERLPAPQPGHSPAGVETWTEADGTIWIVTGAKPVGPAVSVAISDNGTGIPPAVGAQIFEPFFTTKGRGRGTGLGLAVVHRIVLEHGGAILVRTRQDDGTTFQILLPLVLGAADLDDLGDMESGAQDGETASILVVDDDESFCAWVETALKRIGYHVQSTTDPREAEAWARQKPNAYDVLVTDQNMPHINGEELVRFFKAHSPATRSVICTGYSSGINEQRARAAGADGLLLKPFDGERLAGVVARLLQSEDTATR